MLFLTVLISIYFNFSFNPGGELSSASYEPLLSESEDFLLNPEEEDYMQSHQQGETLSSPSSSVDIDISTITKNHYSMLRCLPRYRGEFVCSTVNHIVFSFPFFSQGAKIMELGNILNSIHRALPHFFRMMTYSMEEEARVKYLRFSEEILQKLLNERCKRYFVKNGLKFDISEDRFSANFLNFLRNKKISKIIIKLISNINPNSLLLRRLFDKDIAESIKREIMLIFGSVYGSRIWNKISILSIDSSSSYDQIQSDLHRSLFDLRNHFNMLHELIVNPIERIAVILVYICNKPGFQEIRNNLITMIEELTVKHNLKLIRIKKLLWHSRDRYKISNPEFFDMFELYFKTYLAKKAATD